MLVLMERRLGTGRRWPAVATTGERSPSAAGNASWTSTPGTPAPPTSAPPPPSRASAVRGRTRGPRQAGGFTLFQFLWGWIARRSASWFSGLPARV